MNFTDTLRSILMPAAKPADMKNPGLVLSGDSIMNNQIANKLRALGVLVHDFSQPGDTAQNAWRRFAYDRRTMGTLILQGGTNDISGGRNPVPYLESIAEYAIAEGRRVVFTGITYREVPAAYDWSRVNNDILELADDLNCTHAGWNTVPYSSGDGLHPDDAMNDRLVAKLMLGLAS